MRVLGRGAVAAVAVALVTMPLVAAPERAGAAAFSPCSPDSTQECAELAVPVDRTGAVSGTLTVAAVREPAAGPSRGTVIYIPGGPGAPGQNALGDVAPALGPAGARYDVIAFDPRGTGASGALACPDLQRKEVLTLAGAAARRCAARLGAARQGYLTAETVEDVEAIRAAAGAERLILYGVSYGTVVAQAYAAAHPERVERMLLDSSLPATGFDPFWRSTAQAVPRVLGELCDERACPPGSAARRLESLAGRLARGPITGSFRERGRNRRARMHARDLIDLLIVGDVVRSLRTSLPRALAAREAGRNGPLVRMVARMRGGAPDALETNYAVFASTICQESPGLPWPRAASPAGRADLAAAAARAIPRRDLAPLNRAVALTSDRLGLCSRWPASPVAGLRAASLPDVPALLVSGSADLRTPLEDSRTIAASLPRAHHLIVPGAGHVVLPQRCASRAVSRFLRDEAVGLRPCDRSRGPSAQDSPPGGTNPFS